MRDPVNGFDFPPEWLSRSRLQRDELEKGISSGRLVILSDGSVLRRGFTTGTTAAAAAKAAVLSLERSVDMVDVTTPAGIRVSIPVNAKGGEASARKDSGEHGFDVTDGIVISASARIASSSSIIAGSGIGRKNGKPAITREPMRQIKNAIEEAVSELGIQGAEVALEVNDGEGIARKTLNPAMGITGGISILGTSGFVEPWNEHVFADRGSSITGELKVVLTTGRLGLKYSHVLFPGYKVVLMGSGFSRGLGIALETIICGLPGLILRWGAPDILDGTGFSTVQELVDADPESRRIDDALEKALRKAKGARIVLLNRDGSVLRDTGIG
ncbi:MAG TPA: cobalt-precorrin-5B (C(1))-methyltransferase [Candidatus Methanoperedenaceae archaeon]|nr:cobalt-precorrin-5B (C(1))-methyltransferase [Candidatus Methanoperedenaceae archaeon]